MKIEKFKDPITKRYKWSADFTCERTRHRIVADSTTELYDEIDSIKRRARRKKLGIEVESAPVYLSQLVEARSQDLRLDTRNGKRDKVLLEMFRDHFADDPSVQSLKIAHLKTFAQVRRVMNPKLKTSSLKTEFNAIHAMLNSAGTHFPSLESWKPPRLTFNYDSRQGRERVITEEELAKLFFQLRAPRKKVESLKAIRNRATVADLYDITLMTGMRRTEGRVLPWTRIDWTITTLNEADTIYGFIILPGTVTKTKEPRRVPINRDVRQILERRRAERTSPWVFPNAAGTGPINEKTLYRVFRKAAEEAEIAYGQRTENGFTYHDSRHTAATLMIERGAHLKTVGEILGHADETMTMRYSHARPTALAHAVASLGKPRSAEQKPASPSKTRPTKKR